MSPERSTSTKEAMENFGEAITPMEILENFTLDWEIKLDDEEIESLEIGTAPEIPKKKEKPAKEGRYSSDNLSIYLEQIAKSPLLTPAQEVNLVKKIERGDEKAKEKMINSNQRLVVSIAKHHVNRGLEFLDLIQAGNEGLLKVVDKFNRQKGYKFSTYATHWIRQSIQRTITNEGRAIRTPINMAAIINKFKQIERQLTQEKGRETTNEEIAEKMEVTLEKLEKIKKVAQPIISLETPIGEKGESCLGDFIASPEDGSKQDKTRNPFELASSALLKEQIQKLLETHLIPKERMIIELRFGLNDGRPRTLQEVGDQFSLTKERIKQIEEKVLNKLRGIIDPEKLGILL